jgi:hypothetical protein
VHSGVCVVYRFSAVTVNDENNEKQWKQWKQWKQLGKRQIIETDSEGTVSDDDEF